MGVIYRKLSHKTRSEIYLDDAIRVYEESIEVYARLGYLDELAMAYNNLALVYKEYGDLTGKKNFYYDAIQSFNESLKFLCIFCLDFCNDIVSAENLVNLFYLVIF